MMHEAEGPGIVAVRGAPDNLCLGLLVVAIHVGTKSPFNGLFDFHCKLPL